MAEAQRSDVDHRALGVALYNDAWRLLRAERTADEDAELLHQAHASAYHWSQAPECEPKNRARGEWLCSRVYAVLGRAEPALHHAARCREIVEANPESMEEFDLPFAYEALARAYALAGDLGGSRQYVQLAREAAGRIADDEDRQLLLDDLATIG